MKVISIRSPLIISFVVISSFTVGTAMAKTAISVQQADRIAMSSLGGGTVQKYSLDTYHKQPVYDIHLSSSGNEWDVKVARFSGAVLSKQHVIVATKPLFPATPSGGITFASIKNTLSQRIGKGGDDGGQHGIGDSLHHDHHHDDGQGDQGGDH
nr:PepSY domain-containing protein [Bacilli bacterium]